MDRPILTHYKSIDGKLREVGEIVPHQPPCPTFSSRQLARVLPIADARSRGSAWVLALTMAATTLLFQAIVAPGASVMFLYLLLAAQSVWFLGGPIGAALTASTVIAGSAVAAIGMRGGVSIPHTLQAWNLASRLLSIGLIGFLLAGLRNALAVERWRASTDQLTGALNRAAFEERIGPTIRQAEAANEAVILAYLDLDGFKGVNDRHGHAAGNLVLTTLAHAARAAIRPADIFARMGGDEFVALLRVPNAADGDRVAEALHNRLTAILVGTGYAVTCSTGALVMEARRMAQEDAILEQADRLMYVAKQSGKNTLHIGRGEAMEALLRAAFPPEPVPNELRGILRWIDHSDRIAPPRRPSRARKRA